MSFGLGQFCQQMTTHNAPLKLAPDAPVIGRFFPQHCTQQTLANGDLWVQFDGFGYAWTEPLEEGDVHVGRDASSTTRTSSAPTTTRSTRTSTRAPSRRRTFASLQIEQPVANLMQNWIAPFADNFGQQMVSGQLAQGFTVIQDDERQHRLQRRPPAARAAAVPPVRRARRRTA